jgi:hypothetical protein
LKINYFFLGTGASSDLAVPLLQQLLPSALEQVLEQPDLASPELEQHDFAGVSLLVLTFSVFALSADVTFCAEAVVTVKARIRVNSEITSAIFFIVVIDLMVLDNSNAKVLRFVGQ